MRKLLTVFIILFSCSSVFSQNSLRQDRETFSSKFMRIMIDDGDTVFVGSLPPAVKFAFPRRGKDGKAWRKYYRLVHNFSKTYPYALLAKEKLVAADEHIAKENLRGKAKDDYYDKVEKELFKTFEQPLRKLTYTQGRLLLRLIERETGLTPYYIIKEYRSGFSAVFWQGVARLFGANLKIPYNKFGEDRNTEELILLYQEGHFNHLYLSIFGKMPVKPVVSPKKDFPQTIGW